MATYEPHAVAGGGWRLAVPQNGASYVVLAAMEPELEHGALRATVVLLRDTIVLAKDRVNLTRAAARTTFLERLTAAHAITVEEGALLALEIACRTTATIRHGNASPETGPVDGTADEAPVGPPPVPLRPLSELLDAVVTFLTTYIVFPTVQHAKVVALWIAHSHAIDGCELTPYLSISSAQKRCGKSHLLKLIARLVRRAWLVAGPSAATVYRMIDERRPTMCVDEVDTIFKAKGSEGAEALRGVLNVGNDRDVKIPRCVGQQYEQIKEFSPFCAKVYTGIGQLPDTVADRSVPVELVRRKKSEPIRRWCWRDIKAAAVDLQAELAAWATADVIEALRGARPAIPRGLHDRAEDLWEPLLAIADLAGGSWPGEARAAAQRIMAGADDDDAIGVRLLVAMRDVFAATGDLADDPELPGIAPDTPKGVTTVVVLAALIDRQTDPWGDWWGEDVQRALEKAEKATPPAEPKCPQRPASRLAALLRPFGIQPRNIRIAEVVRKGYAPADFRDAFERYLDPVDPSPRAPDPRQKAFHPPSPPLKPLRRYNPWETRTSGVAAGVQLERSRYTGNPWERRVVAA